MSAPPAAGRKRRGASSVRTEAAAHGKFVEPVSGEGRSRYHVEALSRGLTLLKLLSLAVSPMSVSDLAQSSGMTIATAFRIIRTLSSLGFVESAGAREYRLSYKTIRLGYNAFAHSDFADLAAPILKRLHRQTGDSVFLSVLAVPNIVSIVRIVPPKRLHVVGHVFPLHATAEGKILIGHLDDGKRRLSAALLPQRLLVPHGTVSREAFLEEAAEAARCGWATTDEELVLGTRGVAAPIFDSSGVCVAAAALVSTRNRRTLAEMTGPLREQLLQVTGEINTLLGLRHRTALPPEPAVGS